ncbi:MAG TPA: holo-ACP synthase [Candidatus Babeliales bacterium]|nr:holo-ACP synthase [Candidatus Babeliales bacterium]
MILGIGVDIVEIERFALWHTYSSKKLSRIFSVDEITYCLENKNKSAERFAVRFAAREALYKALCYAYPNNKLPFLTLCAHTTIKKIEGRPYIFLNKDTGADLDSLDIHLSWSHSRTHATTFIILERK